MTPELLAFLTPQEQTIYHETVFVSPGEVYGHLQDTLTALAEARQGREEYRKAMIENEVALKEAQQHLQQAREAVEKYGKHLDQCCANPWFKECLHKVQGSCGICRCGLDASLAGGTQ